MRILGIDYGTKRIGVAVSDENLKFAFPLCVLANTGQKLDELKKIAKDNSATEFVMGESRGNDMTPNAILPDILDLKESLEDLGFKVYLELEFMTSLQAEKLQGKHEKIDASAAALILQSFLDRRANEKNQ